MARLHNATPQQDHPGGEVASSTRHSGWTRQRIIRLTGIIVVLATVAILGRALLTPAPTHSASDKVGPPAPAVGHYAPDITATTLNGQHISLSSLKGKPVLLNFWYVECEPCRYEMPALERAYQANQKQGLVIVGVNMTDSAQTAGEFVHKLGVTYPIWLDNKGQSTVTYQVVATPTTFFIDRQGVIRYKVAGALTDKVLQQDLTGLLR